MTYDELIDALGGDFGGKIFTKRRMNYGKLNNVIGSYAQGEYPDDIIVIIDDTVFGNAKVGMAISNKYVYVKNDMESVIKFHHDEIEDISFKRSIFSFDVYVNGKKVKDFTQPDKNDLENLFLIIQKYFRERECMDEDLNLGDDYSNKNLENFMHDEKKYQGILNIISQDNLYRNLSIDQHFNTFMGAVDFLLGSKSPTGRQAIRDELGKYMIKNIIKLRKHAFENSKLGIYFLNNFTTMHLLFYVFSILRLQLYNMGVPEEYQRKLFVDAIQQVGGGDPITSRRIIDVLDGLYDEFFMIFLMTKSRWR